MWDAQTGCFVLPSKLRMILDFWAKKQNDQTMSKRCETWHLDILCRMYPNLQIHNFAMHVVYPWNSMEMKAVFQERHTKLPEGSIGIHWYAGHPLAQRHNSRMNEGNYHEYNNTISYHMENICSATQS